MDERDPITQTVAVRGSVERAFRVFTDGMSSWWPLETHSVAVDQELGQRAVDLKVEGHVGGRIEEVLEDGSTRDWGEVTAWEPPGRVVYAWKPNDRPIPPTEVEVRFTAQDDGTRVDLEHRGWEALSPASDEIRPLYASEGGWPFVLERYVAAVESGG